MEDIIIELADTPPRWPQAARDLCTDARNEIVLLRAQNEALNEERNRLWAEKLKNNTSASIGLPPWVR